MLRLLCLFGTRATVFPTGEMALNVQLLSFALAVFLQQLDGGGEQRELPAL